MKRLLEKEATSPENKPVWYEIYEAFPPKYEPRYDRHTLPHGVGSRVKSMPPPPKIFYKEDKLRAQYYKAFMPTDTDKEVLPVLEWKCENCGLPNKGFRELSDSIARNVRKLIICILFIGSNNQF